MKNYGAAVSGYLDPTGRNWETPVFQKGKAVLDKELNLVEDIAGLSAQAGLRLSLPSGWLDDRFVTTSQNAPYWLASTVANELRLEAGLRAHVNGWVLDVSNTGSTDGTNRLGLGAGPSGAGARRTDLVVLEVWRTLVSPSPSTAGKSQTGRIWRQGNVKVASGQDTSLNFVDDILDATLNVETTKRVQIQYRLRVMPGIDVQSYPCGLDDPGALARSAPQAANSPDGNTTAFAYQNQAAAGDAGLWRAGDGNPANTLGTVDGYVYAVPVCAVFRRNTTAFARNTNHNGGVATGGSSDRPDGLFHDIFVRRDVLDLRYAVQPEGFSFTELLARNTGWLLDNAIRTEVTSTTIGGGTDGHTVLWADEIGISNANGGDGVVTGDTPGAEFIGEFDATRRTFSDRPVLETVVVVATAPGGSWTVGDVVTIDPTALAVYPYAAFNWAAYNPATVVWRDVLAAQWVGDPSSKTYDAMPSLSTITGLSAMPVTSVSLTVASVPAGLTNEKLYVTLLVAYPPGQGLSKTPAADFGAASFTVNNPAQLTVSNPVNFDQFYGGNAIDATHREVRLQYLTIPQTFTFQAIGPTTATGFTLPERADQIIQVYKNGTPIIGYVALDTSGRTATFTNSADNTSPSDYLSVVYTAIRPMPKNNEQMTIYYEARAPQSARGSLVGTTLTVIPRQISAEVHSITVGPGSQDEGYPYPVASTQVGGIYLTSGGTFSGDHELAGRADVAVTDFSATTGYLRLPTFVGYVPDPEAVTFTRGTGDVDIEGRTYFPSVPGGGYVPNAYAQQFSDPKRHRNLLTFVAELPVDSSLGKRGQLVLVLLVREAIFDANNSVSFDANLANNTTTAAVVRLKGNPLLKRI